MEGRVQEERSQRRRRRRRIRHKDPMVEATSNDFCGGEERVDEAVGLSIPYVWLVVWEVYPG
jgi:hypothetical protein